MLRYGLLRIGRDVKVWIWRAKGGCQSFDVFYSRMCERI